MSEQLRNTPQDPFREQRLAEIRHIFGSLEIISVTVSKITDESARMNIVEEMEQTQTAVGQIIKSVRPDK